MLKSLKSNSYRFVVVLLLLLTFLTTGMVGKVSTVYALADPVVDTVNVLPVYDTTIVQFQDYIENVLTESQGDIFYIMLGMFLAAQAGSSEYELYNPHTSEGDLLNWLKDCGIQLYNSVVLKVVQPDPLSGIDIRPALSTLLAYYMGVAVKASEYNTVQDFLDDVSISEKYCLPLSPDSMFNLNLLLQSEGGLGQWQVRSSSFTSSVEYLTYGGVPTTLQNAYINYLNSLSYLPIVRIQYPPDNTFANGRVRGQVFTEFHNLFINTLDQKYYFYDDLGNPLLTRETGTVLYPNVIVYTPYNNSSHSFTGVESYSAFTANILLPHTITNFSNFSTYQDMTQSIYNGSFIGGDYFVFYEDFVEHVYYGADWDSKHEIYNTSDLDFVDLANPYFLQPTQNILLDIKGLLNDLLNTTDLHEPFVNNIYLPDYTPYNIEDLVKISVDAIIDAVADPPIPVNLNNIQLYTDNEYLDVVKHRSLQASDTIGEYVAFWHNCDSELVYAILGSFIVILIGAFIGKWGHS